MDHGFFFSSIKINEHDEGKRKKNSGKLWMRNVWINLYSTIYSLHFLLLLFAFCFLLLCDSPIITENECWITLHGGKSEKSMRQVIWEEKYGVPCMHANKNPLHYNVDDAA